MTRIKMKNTIMFENSIKYYCLFKTIIGRITNKYLEIRQGYFYKGKKGYNITLLDSWESWEDRKLKKDQIQHKDISETQWYR